MPPPSPSPYYYYYYYYYYYSQDDEEQKELEEEQEEEEEVKAKAKAKRRTRMFFEALRRLCKARTDKEEPAQPAGDKEGGGSALEIADDEIVVCFRRPASDTADVPAGVSAGFPAGVACCFSFYKRKTSETPEFKASRHKLLLPAQVERIENQDLQPDSSSMMDQVSVVDLFDTLRTTAISHQQPSATKTRTRSSSSTSTASAGDYNQALLVVGTVCAKPKSDSLVELLWQLKDVAKELGN